MPLSIVILAAGKGSRIKTHLPKVLHPVGGLPMLGHVLRTAAALNPQQIVMVLAPDDVEVRAALPSLLEGYAIPRPLFVEQKEPLGTGDAVKAALPFLSHSEEENVLILCGDTPLLSPDTLRNIINAPAPLCLGAMEASPPHGYGRLLIREGKVVAIIEALQATPKHLDVTLCYSGVMRVSAHILQDLLPHVRPTAPKNEYYFTDLVALAHAAHKNVTWVTGTEEEFSGVNTQMDLARTEAIFQNQLRHSHLSAGVRMIDPSSVYFSFDTRIGPDTVIYPHVFFGTGVTVGSHATIRPFSVLTQCTLEDHVAVGPCAHLRPGTHLETGARVGNFVEIKNSRLGPAAHADHLTYLGDTQVGAKASIGAGTITCNYNGTQKFPTSIAPGAFIGSNTTLVAPLHIGANAFVAAGSVITKDVSENAMAFGRSFQQERPGYAEIFRKKALLEKQRQES